MVTVLQHHLPCILYRFLFPFRITDMLPARYFRKHKQPDLVAAVQKILRLRIMGSTHRVTGQFRFDQDCIPPLHRLRHGVSDIWKGLMTVHAAQFELFAV